MFFTKYPHPANFSYLGSDAIGLGEVQVGQRAVHFSAESFKGGVHHIKVSHDSWPSNRSLHSLTPPEGAACGVGLDKGQLTVKDEKGKVVLRGAAERSFGLNAKASLFCFEVDPGARFFGMGEKNFGDLELSGRRTVFWNTDVWSDFHFGQWKEYPTDPSYFSTPYVAMRTKSGYVGLLLHNPSPAFMETPGSDESRAFLAWQRTSEHLMVGSLDGEPNLWVITAPDLAGLTRKLQALIGTTPLPPLWSLGYQQSRWGYGGHEDLSNLDHKCTTLEIPCTGLWLDIDHMVGYRVFTVDKTKWPNDVEATAADLAKSGRRIVPIIDPGVKREAGYEVYESGLKAEIFCLNNEGKPFVGIVWPGETVYPDFTLAEGRDWWAEYAQQFRCRGFGACWVDMNDPSTGPSSPDSMLFERGARTHNEHRNQYALGMQMATHKGFLMASPNERPFILSRSGCVGSHKYAAIWTGDNVSNDFHLKLALTTLLGMSISGQPFAGADVGGFGNDTSAKMLVRWTQAAFLSPFMRNHTNIEARLQEPWAYDELTLSNTRHFIQLRHQFLPYIYNLFARQEADGTPMMRPVLFDFDDPLFDNVGDQVMVGPWLMHAPVIKVDGEKREVLLPGNDLWLDLRSAEWVKPGAHTVEVAFEESPLYLRAGALVPVQAKRPKNNVVDLNSPMFLVGVPPKWSGQSQATHVADDGLSYDYQRGRRTKAEVLLHAKGGEVTINWQVSENGFGDFTPSFAFFDKPRKVILNGVEAKLIKRVERFTGGDVTFYEAKNV